MHDDVLHQGSPAGTVVARPFHVVGVRPDDSRRTICSLSTLGAAEQVVQLLSAPYLDYLRLEIVESAGGPPDLPGGIDRNKTRGPLTLLMTNRRARRWAAVVVVAMLVGYPLSYPWCNALLIHFDTQPSSPLLAAVTAFYAPFGWAYQHCPETVQNGYLAYHMWSVKAAGVRLDR